MEPAARTSRFVEVVRSALGDHARRVVQIPHKTAAAVLILMFERDGEPYLVFTRRTETVRHHKGEISFPGGARDPEDDDLVSTAIRETVEELGVDPKTIEILGGIDDIPTFATDYVVSPFVASIPEPHGWQASEREIAEVIEIPLTELARVGRFDVYERAGRTFPTHLFHVGNHTIWGATAWMLRQFLDIVGPALDLPAPEEQRHAE
jgi:8-oxo-dGTP pyrophosphatase MutT (NUDIX family)